MKKLYRILSATLLCFLLFGCKQEAPVAQVVATTLPVYNFTLQLCKNTDISVARLITENVSCLHNYTLQVSQMRAIEGAGTVVISGAGLEDFLEDVLEDCDSVIDASSGITLHCQEEETHRDHHHQQDSHIWLSPDNAKVMAGNICRSLIEAYPQHADIFRENLKDLEQELTELKVYGEAQLKNLTCRDLITFHDGFTYLAEAFDLTILHAIEEESGSEASAQELIELTGLVKSHNLPAVFTEINGSTSAAHIIAAETGVRTFALDMAMGKQDYFTAMRYNIDTLKEALE